MMLHVLPGLLNNQDSCRSRFQQMCWQADLELRELIASVS
ncbi:hypothetical protein T4D_1447 [Trichinella pseudospiralis]|uniref:Uncharacterized protein n=1 Tax=Trichinella pseudospiralis TaxID=6337 RepID=A0A0V1DR53_TRIPS|nr:hypothetical protein T4D_1447 [Trichinella pseudospiralis]